jgi:hypothetical protein
MAKAYSSEMSQHNRHLTKAEIAAEAAKQAAAAAALPK